MSRHDDTYEPRTPDVGDDPREATRDVDAPANKVWFRDLDEAVIEAERCVQCGTCLAACPSDSIGIADSDDRPTLVKMCTGCSRCWDSCPRAGLRYERLSALESDPGPGGTELGPVRDAYAASAAEPVDGCQHGGVVTTLLARLLDAGEIDGAVLATEAADAPGKATATLATTPAAVRETAGSLFTQPLQLDALSDLLAGADLPTDPDLALVGTPCVIEGVAALQRSPYRSDRFSEARPLEHVELTVSLMCTQAFDYDRLGHVLASEFDRDLGGIEGIDLVGNGVRIRTDDGDERASVDEVDGAVLDGCLECGDFSGRTADIAVGAIGSERDESTVLVRTERGEGAWEAAARAVEARPLTDRSPIEQLAAWNRRRAIDALEREFDPEGSIQVPYADHREAYDGTDREPVPFNPARVHQYEEWC